VVYPITDKFCHGIHLLPADTELQFNGLHVLAAVRNPGLCNQVDDRGVDQIVMSILALCSHAPKEVQAQVTAELREGILEQLPATIQMIAADRRAPNLGFLRREPRRTATLQ